MSVKEMSNKELLAYFKETDSSEAKSECLSRMTPDSDRENREIPLENQMTFEDLIGA